jgi:diguanylate cyclase (GGDEF)-like protein
MDSTKIGDVLKGICDKIAQEIRDKEREGAKETEIARDAIASLFTRLGHAGYGMELDEFIHKKVEQASQRCLHLANTSIENFKQSNENIKEITENHTIQIEQIEEEENRINVDVFKNRFRSFQTDLMGELERANAVIQSLEKEIDTLQKQSNIDPLTKLYNRKALEMDGKELLKYSNSRKLDLVALMIDADDFKKVNDNFGHIAGDKVLILLAKLLRSSIRETDKAYRYGGEEFLILFNRAKKEDAVKVAQRIMNLVRKNKLVYKDKEIHITLSMGLTEHRKGDTLESLIERADRAVYEAKRAGKDRLVIV